MPTVTELQLFAVDLPFKTAFRHAAAARTTSESLFLRMALSSGVDGWGEALPRAYVSGESRQDAFALLRDRVLPALVGRTFQSLPEVFSFLEKCDGKAPSEWVPPDIPQTSAWCCVDLALLDAFGREFGDPVAPDGQPSGGALERYRYSGVVSAGRGWPYVKSLLKMRAFGFPQVKLKLGEDGALQAARTARRLLGRRVDLRVDANMAWDVDRALEVIQRLRTVGIRSFEQPIAAGDLSGLARLVRESSAGIVVDEGLTDRESLQALISHQACTGANVRISKCGGLVGAYARCREALDAGLVLQVGCQVGESSLLSAAHLALLSALAPVRPGVRYAEGCFGRHLLREDPAVPLLQFGYGGRPPPRPPGAGLGVRIDQAMLVRWAVDQARVT
jgi:L-alanine-DL-glutamate epimerase-like enolase superfamily enzyme